MEKDRKLLLVILVAALLIICYIAFAPIVIAGARAAAENVAEATTPYGESLSIKIGSGTQTSGSASVIEFIVPASWAASYQGSDTQNVYTVDGVYKSQEQVTLSYTLSVTHSNVENIKATVKIKALGTGSYEYTLANLKALTGTSPISDNGQTQKSISAHLTDTGSPTSGATISYQIYCQVTATGAVSGDTLTATVAYTQFGQLVYLQSTEASAAEVTPTISVASYVDDAFGLPHGSFFVAAIAAAVVVYYKVVRAR